MSRRTEKANDLSRALLRKSPVPAPAKGGDKNERGRLVVVGGCREVPGAVQLAAEAGLRAGAGKLQILTPQSIALVVAGNVPEALVRGVAESKDGGFSPASFRAVGEAARKADCALLGPGLSEGRALESWLKRLLAELTETPLVVDAGALVAAGKCEKEFSNRRAETVFTPHAGELARVLNVEREEVEASPIEHAQQTARRWQAVVVMKGATSYVVTPDGKLFRNQRGNVGLATSGSGDVLAGIIAGLLARGANALCATNWGVWLHALSAEALAKDYGELGFLARELPANIPRLLQH